MDGAHTSPHKYLQGLNCAAPRDVTTAGTLYKGLQCKAFYYPVRVYSREQDYFTDLTGKIIRV